MTKALKVEDDSRWVSEVPKGDFGRLLMAARVIVLDLLQELATVTRNASLFCRCKYVQQYECDVVQCRQVLSRRACPRKLRILFVDQAARILGHGTTQQWRFAGAYAWYRDKWEAIPVSGATLSDAGVEELSFEWAGAVVLLNGKKPDIALQWPGCGRREDRRTATRRFRFRGILQYIAAQDAAMAERELHLANAAAEAARERVYATLRTFNETVQL